MKQYFWRELPKNDYDWLENRVVDYMDELMGQGKTIEESVRRAVEFLLDQNRVPKTIFGWSSIIREKLGV